MQTTSGRYCQEPSAKGETQIMLMLHWLTSEPWEKKQFKEKTRQK